MHESAAASEVRTDFRTFERYKSDNLRGIRGVWINEGFHSRRGEIAGGVQGVGVVRQVAAAKNGAGGIDESAGDTRPD